MLACSRKLTARVAQMQADDVGKLRHIGFSDLEILEINLAAAYINFVNRIAEGLCELEASMQSFSRLFLPPIAPSPRRIPRSRHRQPWLWEGHHVQLAQLIERTGIGGIVPVLGM